MKHTKESLNLQPGEFFRTCQECDHVQRAKAPNPKKELSDAYCWAACRHCKSPALDYGTEHSGPVDDWYDEIEPPDVGTKT